MHFSVDDGDDQRGLVDKGLWCRCRMPHTFRFIRSSGGCGAAVCIDGTFLQWTTSLRPGDVYWASQTTQTAVSVGEAPPLTSTLSANLPMLRKAGALPPLAFRFGYRVEGVPYPLTSVTYPGDWRYSNRTLYLRWAPGAPLPIVPWQLRQPVGPWTVCPLKQPVCCVQGVGTVGADGGVMFVCERLCRPDCGEWVSAMRFGRDHLVWACGVVVHLYRFPPWSMPWSFSPKPTLPASHLHLPPSSPTRLSVLVSLP